MEAGIQVYRTPSCGYVTEFANADADGHPPADCLMVSAAIRSPLAAAASVRL